MTSRLPVKVELVNTRMIFAFAFKSCSRSPRMTLLCCATSSGNWWKALWVAAEESLDPRVGGSSNNADPGVDVVPLWTLFWEFSDLLYLNGRNRHKHSSFEGHLNLISNKTHSTVTNIWNKRKVWNYLIRERMALMWNWHPSTARSRSSDINDGI